MPLNAIAVVLLLYLVGEAIVRILTIPIPGSIIGLMVLFLYLLQRGRVSSALTSVGDPVLGAMPLFFIPAGVGLFEYGDLLGDIWPAVTLAIVGSTLVGLITTTLVMRLLAPSTLVATSEAGAVSIAAASGKGAEQPIGTPEPVRARSTHRWQRRVLAMGLTGALALVVAFPSSRSFPVSFDEYLRYVEPYLPRREMGEHRASANDAALREINHALEQDREMLHSMQELIVLNTQAIGAIRTQLDIVEHRLSESNSLRSVEPHPTKDRTAEPQAVVKPVDAGPSSRACKDLPSSERITMVEFAPHQGSLSATHIRRLDLVISLALDCPHSNVRVSSYADGVHTRNTKLSSERGNLVAEYLMEHGLKGARISVRHLGEHNLERLSPDERAHARNRRVIVSVEAKHLRRHTNVGGRKGL
jgi:holin-like protein